ncbi:MAG: hypothetical protein IJS52_04165 [Bacilli bacterium]|nr:hypothetical protein [Bacilli bacterium]
MSKPSSYQARFDRLLSAYQRISLFLILPPLISAFSAVVGLFNAEYPLTLCLSLVQGTFPLVGEFGRPYALILSLALLFAYVPLSMFSAKGKGWCFFLGAGLYAADLIYGAFLFGNLGSMRYAILLLVHVLFVAAYVAGTVFYLKARALLKEHPREILGK